MVNLTLAGNNRLRPDKRFTADGRPLERRDRDFYVSSVPRPIEPLADSFGFPALRLAAEGFAQTEERSEF